MVEMLIGAGIFCAGIIAGRLLGPMRVAVSMAREEQPLSADVKKDREQGSVIHLTDKRDMEVIP